MLYRFADCELDTRRHALRRAGAEVHVEPQVFDLIHCLAGQAGALVEKEALVAAVWNGLAVSDATINARISAARKAVGDDGSRQAVIRTVQRKGFVLAVPVTVEANGAASAVPAALPSASIRYARSADGVAIAWSESGAGPPLIRAGHWLSDLDLDLRSVIWGPLIDRLAAAHRLIRFDFRAMGKSQRGVAPAELDTAVADLAAVADAAGAGRFSIVAPSQAVPVAVAFAARYPDRVDRLVLYSGYALGRALREPVPGELDEPTALSMIRTGWGREGSVFLEAFSRIFVPDATEAQIADMIEMQTAAADAETAAAIRRTVDRYDVRDLLGAVRAPSLVLHAEGDVVQPAAQAQLLASGLPDARLVLLPGRNHIPLPQTPAWSQMMAAAEAFLAEGAEA